jgi:chemotaxis family two-component system sensor kinase Cph1
VVFAQLLAYMRQRIRHLRAGDHAALFYRNRAEQFAAVIPYLHEGLRRNEKCLYIVSENTIKSVIDAMEAEGINVEDEQRRGALTLATPRETYLKHGVFEPQKMIDDLASAVERALAQGFAAFRATGELMWAVSLPSALARVFEYEASLDLQFPDQFIGLCQYNENGFAPQILSQILRVHPIVLARGRLISNPFYVGRVGAVADQLPLVSIDKLIESVTVPDSERVMAECRC